MTPASVSAWQKISLIEAGHFDSNTAYAAANTMRIDDLRPHIFATYDGGKTWVDDLIVATHGRGFWALDNLTPLRQLNRNQRENLLFKPQTALRVRVNLNTDTPLPPDEPAGENPPDGAMIDYFLSKDASGPVTIEIKDGKGQSVRKYSSADAQIEANPKRLKIPSYWIRPPQSVSTKAGMHRFLWVMHYTPVPNVEPEFPISATYRNTAPEATSPWAAPADYTVTLTIGGKTFSQPLTVAMDPRVKTSAADLQEEFDLSWRLYQVRLKLAPIGKKFDDIAEQLTKVRAQAAERPDVTQKLEAFAQTLVRFGPPHPRPGAPPSLFVLESTTAVQRHPRRRCCADSRGQGRRRGSPDKSRSDDGRVAQITRIRSSRVESAIEASGISGNQNRSQGVKSLSGSFRLQSATPATAEAGRYFFSKSDRNAS